MRKTYNVLLRIGVFIPCGAVLIIAVLISLLGALLKAVAGVCEKTAESIISSVNTAAEWATARLNKGAT